MFPRKLIHFYIGRCNVPSVYLRSGFFWNYCKEENTISAIQLVLLRDNYSIIISQCSYMWGLVFYSSVENIWMRMKPGFTNKVEAHQASLANPGKMVVACVLEIHLSGINDLSIMYCICSEGVVFFIFHLMNQFTIRQNNHIVIVINTFSCIYLIVINTCSCIYLIVINTCSCIYLTGFIFSL